MGYVVAVTPGRTVVTWKCFHLTIRIENKMDVVQKNVSWSRIYFFTPQLSGVVGGYFLASSLESQSNPSYKPCPCVAHVAWMYHLLPLR